jgi:hypothetical protein
MPWVHIFTAKNEIEATLIKGLLKAHGIESRSLADDPNYGGNFPTAGTTLHLVQQRLFVQQTNAAEASLIISDRPSVQHIES